MVRKFREMILRWERYRAVRSRMEDLFKLAKNAFSLDKLHRYTRKSVKLNVLLLGMIVSMELGRKKSCTGLFTCRFWEDLTDYTFQYISVFIFYTLNLFLNQNLI